MPAPWKVVDLGNEDYRTTWSRQLALVEQRQKGEVGDTLLVVEHPHVFTLGRRREAAGNVLAPGDVEVIEIERGGDVTYHGPGQIVAYPIVFLDGSERDLHAYLRNLESAVIATWGWRPTASPARPACGSAPTARARSCARWGSRAGAG
jgi:lipoyl(octanoyl) transferase